MNWCCSQLNDAIAADDVPIEYTAKFREVKVSVLDGGTSGIVLTYCPWCGTKLPISLRHQWFAELEQMGIDPHSESVPVRFQSDAWYSMQAPSSYQDDKR